MQTTTQAGPLPPLHPADGYLRVNYRHHYAELLRIAASPPQAIAELCLFRFWLACRAHHLAHAGHIDAPTPMPPPDWPLPRDAGGLDIERTLGGELVALLESRMQLYDCFVLLGRNGNDPHGLDAAALALSCQLFVQPPPAARAGLQTETRQLFARLHAACAATEPATA